MGVADGNVALAFGLVIIAGLCTTVGSTFAFCANLSDPLLLAGALGVSAGVMIYVSFGEIFMVKSVEGFADSGMDDDTAMRTATFCFFGGMLITALLDRIVHWCTGSSGKHGANGNGEHSSEAQKKCSGDADCESGIELEVTDESAKGEQRAGSEAGPIGSREEAERLKQMGLMTGIAIALHNFPEGLATFVAALADTRLGIAIAIAIALHNIPEGVCVAMPVYYASGSRWQGFWWSFLSGVSEPIGGLLGYLVLYGNNMKAEAYGALFGVVGGMMVYISFVELLPTALKYDPENKVVSSCTLVGMAVMAASLLMFTI